MGKREIVRAFRIGGGDRIQLKAVMRELRREGALERRPKRKVGRRGHLPPVTVLEVSGIDADGELLARPAVWDEDTVPPTIYLAPEKRGRSALAVGDRVLAKLRRVDDSTYEARPIHRIETAPRRVLGIYEIGDEGGRLRPTDRRARKDFILREEDAAGAQPGELVLAEVRSARPRLGLRAARVLERLGEAGSPRALSLIAIHEHDLPVAFSPEALTEAEAAGPAGPGERVDLRDLPLVTIDGADARDFDDAVWAEPDPDPANPGGWHAMVAIADVAWYVRPDSGLDRAAFERGNSAYFPDRVVPMLPEALSNGWCSLNPDQERPCLAAELWIDAEGNTRRHRFLRGLMRSAARLTYEQVQAARDGRPDAATEALVETVIAPLYGVLGALLAARRGRGTLDLDLPERRIVLDDAGAVAAIEPRARLDSHRLIEELMIAANIAAARQLEALGQPCMYRVHDRPDPVRIEALRQVLDSLGLRLDRIRTDRTHFAGSIGPVNPVYIDKAEQIHAVDGIADGDSHQPRSALARGQVIRAKELNRLLDRVSGDPAAPMVNMMILRAQAQAAYSPGNIGHFGLALTHYAHFTSPIRRYADLLVHRALVAGLKLGEGALPAGAEPRFAEIGEHISMTERRAATAERDAVDRFTAAFLQDRLGAVFSGAINGVTRFGLFVTLDETGADGLVPMSLLPDDYYDHIEAKHCLVGRRWGRTYRLGERVAARLLEAEPITGGLILELVEASKEARAETGGARREPARNTGTAGWHPLDSKAPGAPGAEKSARRQKPSESGRRKRTPGRRGGRAKRGV
ncbi:MAG: RNB domain-containing ribonuclease [Proteobacteria bacterium]|nr:RNB domain-containing ribonuclease [Pseudomonadota bacterium]